ncbi:MAG: DUF89 family protein [Spirochaetales bacterium]|nr:DUF89 family protein [Spirochaetales bacterium]
MKTYLDCIPCFFRQTIVACKMIGLADNTTKEILDRVALKIPDIEMTASPPAMAAIIHRIIKEYTDNPDPFLEIKQKSNTFVLEIYPHAKKIVEKSKNRLLKAVEIGIAGNIIDYGAPINLDIHSEISKILNSEEEKIKNEDPACFAFDDFTSALRNATTILYLADNAGEIIFDKILLEEIKLEYPHINLSLAVRGEPIINDCTISDALFAGIDKIATIVSNGSDAPGTLLESCSGEFLEIWNKSDLIISKGQGNFESLYRGPGNIFFMFIVKCQVLARDMGRHLQDVILCRNNPE